MRLTNKIRTKIENSVIKKLTKDMEDNLNVKLIELGEIYYDHFFTKEEKEAMENPALKRLFVSTSGGIIIKYISTMYGCKSICTKYKGPKAIPQRYYGYGFDVRISGIENAELKKLAQKVCGMRDDLQSTNEKLSDEIGKILVSVTTIERLREVWPGVDDLYDLNALKKKKNDKQLVPDTSRLRAIISEISAKEV